MTLERQCPACGASTTLYRCERCFPPTTFMRDALQDEMLNIRERMLEEIMRAVGGRSVR